MNLGELRLRPLRPRDYEQLRAMFARNSVPEVTRHFHPFPLDAVTARLLTSHTGRDRYYVAERDGAIVALSMLRGWDAGYEVPSFGILVDRASVQQGIGGRLTDFTIEEARRLGSSKVRLSVYASNDVAYRLYRSRDFVEDSRSKVDTSDGEDVRIVMTKSLAQ